MDPTERVAMTQDRGHHSSTREPPLGLPASFVMFVLFGCGAILGAPTVVGLFWFIPFASVGTLLVIRRPRTSIGWILVGIAWCFILVTANVDATVEQFTDGTVGFRMALIAVGQSSAAATLFFLFALLAIVYPSGRLPSGRWGWISRAALGIASFMIAASFVMPVISVDLVGRSDSVPVANPFALWPDVGLMQLVTPDTVIIPVLLLLVIGVVTLIVRTRRAAGLERQQLRWLGASLALVVAAITIGLILGMLLPGIANTGFIWIPAIVAFPWIAVAVGVAVLRYRLYDIDRIISRSIAWAVVTGSLIAMFSTVVIALQAALANVTQGQTLAVAASTLVAASIFQPLRRRVQRAVDRRFDRARYDAEGTVAAFSERLRDEVDITAVIADLDRTATRSFRPATLVIWLRSGSVATQGDGR